jgi:hypothetical protein
MRKPIYSELLKVTMWHAVMAGTVAFNLVVLVANYAACVQSFELLNSEKKPLADYELFGPLFATFAPEATVADLLAACFEVGVVIGIWWLTHHLFLTIQQLEDRAEYKARGDNESITIINRRVGFNLLRCSVLIVPLYLVVRTVLNLFHYRMLAQAHGVEDGAVAVQQIRTLPLELQDHGHLAAWELIKNGGWGFLAVAAIAAIAFEMAAHHASESRARLAAMLRAPEAQQPANVPPTEPPVEPVPPVEPAHPTNEPSTPKEQPNEVIGGRGRVTTREALAHPDRYWVDPETGAIWDAEYHRTLTEPQPQPV